MDHQVGFWTLLISAVTLGVVHSAAPDHWAPFAAVARAQRWSLLKTAAVAAFAGFGHVTVSAAFGILGVLVGLEIIHSIGGKLEGLVGYLLIAFGLLYALYGWRVRGRHHHTLEGHGFTHSHPRPHELRHSHEHKDVTPLALFALFCLDPCVAVVPIIVAAAPLGWMRVTAVVAVYEAATIAAIVTLSSLAYVGARLIRVRVLESHGALVAGLFIAAVGVFVQVVGI